MEKRESKNIDSEKSHTKGPGALIREGNRNERIYFYFIGGKRNRSLFKRERRGKKKKSYSIRGDKSWKGGPLQKKKRARHLRK